VFYGYRYFLPNNSRYRTIEKHIFNSKEDTEIKPQRMTPHVWKLEYNRNRQGKQLVYVSYILMFCVLICIELCSLYITIIVVISFIFQKCHHGINVIPCGMKRYPIQFNKFPYYHHLKIDHLFIQFIYRRM